MQEWNHVSHFPLYQTSAQWRAQLKAFSFWNPIVSSFFIAATASCICRATVTRFNTGMWINIWRRPQRSPFAWSGGIFLTGRGAAQKLIKVGASSRQQCLDKYLRSAWSWANTLNWKYLATKAAERAERTCSSENRACRKPWMSISRRLQSHLKCLELQVYPQAKNLV